MAKAESKIHRFSNAEVASALAELGELLHARGDNPFRVAAYRNAAVTVRHLDQPLCELFDHEGRTGLEEVRTVGKSIAKKIGELFRTGKCKSLERLRKRHDSDDLIASLPNVGPRLAERIRETLDIHSLEDVLLAALDGRLQRIDGIGRKRVSAIRESLMARLNIDSIAALRVDATNLPSVAEILDIDREYREKAEQGRLLVVAPKQFNPRGTARLPILNTERAGRRFKAHFANTALAHRLGHEHDWVTVSCLDKRSFGHWTVLTPHSGPLRDRRVVRRREVECLAFYDQPHLVQLTLPELASG